MYLQHEQSVHATVTAARAQRQAAERHRAQEADQWGSDEAAKCRADEISELCAILDALYAAVRAGDRTIRTRDRIRRWEAVVCALQGDVAALSR